MKPRLFYRLFPQIDWATAPHVRLEIRPFPWDWGVDFQWETIPDDTWGHAQVGPFWLMVGWGRPVFERKTTR